MGNNKNIIVNSRKVSNFDSEEPTNEAKLLNGNPSGIADFTNPTRKWSVAIYDLQLNYNWHHSEAGVAGDKTRYAKLSDSNKEAYNLALAQLIANDSLQTNQLVDSIVTYITDTIVGVCLTRQASEEALHSRSYSVMVEDVIPDSRAIYELPKHNKQLRRKNKAVEDMYATINNADEITVHDFQLACVANNILEKLVFPGGFITMWSLAEKMPGTAKMIGFIERDESGTHVPLFKNIFRDSVREFGFDKDTELEAIEMIKHMTDEEKIWTKFLTKELFGFTEPAVDMFIEHQANGICKNLKIDPIYEVTDGGPLQSLYDKNSMLSDIKMKTNFFEGTVGDYAVGGLDTDY